MASCRQVTSNRYKKSTSKMGQMIINRFRIVKKVGFGAFGEIYCAEDEKNNRLVAMKFENLKSSFFQLPTEYKFYRTVENVFGFPQCYAYERSDTDILLAIELLGKNLKELYEMCGKSFSLKTVIYIAIQTITRIEMVHSKRYVYRDIKPDNFMIGIPGTENQNTIYIIDFGLVKEYFNSHTGQHIPFREGKPVTGTVRYMSHNAHFNRELSRRDDLESLGYMFMFFLRGSVPWSGIITQISNNNNSVSQSQSIGQMKQSMKAEEMFEGFPKVFADYVDYVRNLEFEAEPDYEMLRSNFKSLFQELDIQDDGIFDWDQILTKSKSLSE